MAARAPSQKRRRGRGTDAGAAMGRHRDAGGAPLLWTPKCCRSSLLLESLRAACPLQIDRLDRLIDDPSAWRRRCWHARPGPLLLWGMTWIEMRGEFTSQHTLRSWWPWAWRWCVSDASDALGLGYDVRAWSNATKSGKLIDSRSIFTQLGGLIPCSQPQAPVPRSRPPAGQGDDGKAKAHAAAATSSRIEGGGSSSSSGSTSTTSSSGQQ